MATERDPAVAPERLVRGYSGRLLLATSIWWLAIQAGRLVTSPLLPQIKNALAIGDARAGFALTVLWGLYALLQYPSGRLNDQLSRKTLLVSGLALAAVGFGVLAIAPTYPVFLLGTVVVGLGALDPTFVDTTATAFDYRLAFSGLVEFLGASAALIRLVTE